MLPGNKADKKCPTVCGGKQPVVTFECNYKT